MRKASYEGIIGMIVTFFYLIYKDIKVFIRRRSSLLLVFISPFIIMILLGTTYSAGTNLMENSNIRGISLAVCDYDNNEVSDVMVQELKNSSFFDMDYINPTFMTEEQCKKMVEEGIYAGKYRVAVIFPSNFTSNILKGHSQELLFLVDNSHTEIRNTVHIFMLAYAQEMSRKVGTKFIQRAWERIGEINQELSSMTDQLGMIQNNATSIKENLQSSQDQLAGFDTAAVQSTINQLDDQINKVETVRNDIGGAVNETKADIDTASNNINEMKSITASTKDQITSTKQRLDAVLTPLVPLQTALVALNQTVQCPSPLCDQLQVVLNSTQSTINELQATRNDLDALDNSLNGVSSNLDQQQVILTRTKAKVEQAEEGVAQAQPEIASVKSRISSLQSVLNQVDDIKRQSGRFFNQANNSIDLVVSSLDSVKPEIDTAKSTLTQFTGYDPEGVVQPIYLNGIDIYKDRRYIDFMLPGIIGLVIMFSCMLLASVSLVEEKNSGVFTRTLLTPTPLVLSLLSRVISNLILTGIQIGILVVVGLVFYHVQILGTMRDVFIASEAVAFSFLTIGLVIGAFSKSENTAILASIALGLPMLFLCGLLFPTELMPSLMRVISSLLPLTYGIDAMRGIIVYGMGVKQVLPAMALLLGQGIVVFWISVQLLKRKE